MNDEPLGCLHPTKPGEECSICANAARSGNPAEARKRYPEVMSSGEGYWLPIRTAPRDGTPILGFCPDALGHGFSDQSGMSVFWWEGRGWTYDGDGREVIDPPTHWMPLPQGPHGLPKRLPATRQMFEIIIAALNYDGPDTDSLTVGEIRRALP